MLPKKNRVRKVFFPEIMKNGLFFHGESLYLRLLLKKDLELPLFSFVVPNKVKKTAVGRHLIKRKISAVVEKNLLNIKPGFFCVIFSKKDISHLSCTQIEVETMFLLRKAKMLKEEAF